MNQLNRPYIYRSRPARKPSTLWLAVLVGVGLNLAGLVLILVLVAQQGTPERPGSGRAAPTADAAASLPSHEEFQAQVLGLSARELLAHLGTPEDIQPASIAPAITSGTGYMDYVQSQALGGGDPDHCWWHYRGVTRHPKTGQPGGWVLVMVSHDHVTRVRFIDETFEGLDRF